MSHEKAERDHRRREPNDESTDTVRLVVCGATGRMGTEIGTLAADDDGLTLIGGFGREATTGAYGEYPKIATLDDEEEVDTAIRSADVVIDVSSPEALGHLIETYPEALDGRALVVGTTGLDDEDLGRLERLSERCAVLVAANFSVGITLLEALVEEATRRLGVDRYDVEIVEAHHRDKVDAPSGTALALGRAIERGHRALAKSSDGLSRRDGRGGVTGVRPRGEVGYHAIRGGGVAGEHRVFFLGEREQVELAHHAADRSLFAEGALVAARWIAGREPGHYTMREVLGLDAP